MKRTCGYSPQELLVSYVLYKFSDFKSWRWDLRVRTRFLFELRCNQSITNKAFLDATERLDPSLKGAADTLSIALDAPWKFHGWAGGTRWTVQETLIALSCHVRGCETLIFHFYVPSRSERAWNEHRLRVIRELEKENVLHDLVFHEMSTRKSVETQRSSISEIEEVRIELFESERRRKECVAKLMRLKRSFDKKFRSLRAKNAVKARMLLAAEKIIAQNLNDGEIIDDEEEVDSSLTKTLLNECQLAVGSPSAKRHYSQFLLDISELLAISSPKTYRILRQMLPLPSVSCLHEHFAATIAHEKRLLLEEARITENVQEVLRNRAYADSNPVISTIGIDAFAFRTFSGTPTMSSPQTTQVYSNAFVFLDIPLDSRYPVRVLHIEPKSNGSYDSSIDERFRAIAKGFAICGQKIWFKSTDGDPFLNREHKDFYKKFLKGRMKDDFTVARTKIHDALCAGAVMPISDPLHFTKNIRGRLLDHDVAVTLGSNEGGSFAYSINAMQLEEILQLRDPLTDASQIGRMRDVYVTRIFTLENVEKLLRASLYHAALLLFPYSCLFSMLYSENLTNDSRVFLASLAYYSFLRLYKEAKILVRAKVGVVSRYNKKCKAVTIAEPVYFKRMLHTCLAFGVSLVFGPRTLRLDSIGTHLVENSIGLARSISNSPKFDMITAAFAKGELRKSLARKYGIKLYVSRRINDGGAKVDTLCNQGVTHEDTWNAYNICSIMLERATGFMNSEIEFEQFIQELSKLAKSLLIKKLTTPSSTANATIMARNIKFCGETGAKANEKDDGQ